MKVTIDGQAYEVDVKPGEIVVDGKAFPVRAERWGGEVTIELGGKTLKAQLQGDTVALDGKTYTVALERPAAPQAAAPAPRPAPVYRPAPAPRAAPPPAAPRPSAAPAPAAPKPAAAPAGGGVAMKAPMPGKILRVLVKEGDKVAFGGVLMVLEAMKMENEIRATVGGTVRSVTVTAGSTVNAGETLALVEEG
jgi:biotin carboxyl carrier protein